MVVWSSPTPVRLSRGDTFHSRSASAATGLSTRAERTVKRNLWPPAAPACGCDKAPSRLKRPIRKRRRTC